MESLPPIPSPPGHRWREFRIKIMPVLVFCAVLSGVAVVWNQHVSVPNVIGEVESVRVNVISILPGHLAELDVDWFERVAKDQVIGRLYPTDPDALKASLVALEMDLRILRARMVLDEQRNEMDYERLRLDCLRQRTELAIARVNLQQAESEFHRVTRLHAEKVESSGALDVAARDQDRLRAEVAEKTRLLTDVEGTLARLAPKVTAGNPHPRPDFISAAIEAQEAQLTLLEGPITLKAPAQGIVSFLNHRPGEKVMAGDPILTITLDRPERIVGYIRQPLRIVPKVGDTVMVRSRGPVRQLGTATVLRVGGEMQTVSAPLRLRGLDSLSLSSAGQSLTASLSPDRGLPFLLNLPEGMEVYPGELVDIIIR